MPAVGRVVVVLCEPSGVVVIVAGLVGLLSVADKLSTSVCVLFIRAVRR